MPVKNICPSKCQFSMPQITKARSLSALAAVVLLAGVSYAVSKPVYNFARQREIMWLKTPFDRIASVRDKVLVKCSLKVDAMTLFNNYRNRIGKNEKIWVNLLIAVGKNDSSEIKSSIGMFLIQSFIECRSLFCVAEQVQLNLSGEQLLFNIHKELMHASTASSYYLNSINRHISPDLLLQLYKLEKNSMVEGNPKEIEDHVKEKLCEGDKGYLVSVMKFLVNNPEFDEAFGDKDSNLERYKEDIDGLFNGGWFDQFSARHKIECLLEYLEVLTSIDNEKDLVNKYAEKLAEIVANDYSAAASQNLDDDDIALRLDSVVIR